MAITESRMTQLTGPYADLDKSNMLVGEMAVPSDHVPVVRNGVNSWEDLLTSQSTGEIIALSETMEQQITDFEQLEIDKVGINDSTATLTQAYSGSKTQGLIDGVNSNLDAKANKSDLNTQKERIDNIVTSASNYYIKCLSTDSGALFVVASGATTGQINIASVSPKLDTYTPVAGDYVRLVSNGLTAELVDARLGADGIIYTNMGSAIRGQINDLDGSIKNVLLSALTKFSTGYFIKADGTLSAGLGHAVVTLSMDNVSSINFTPVANVGVPYGVIKNSSDQVVFVLGMPSAGVVTTYNLDLPNGCTLYFNWFNQNNTFVNNINVIYKSVIERHGNEIKVISENEVIKNKLYNHCVNKPYTFLEMLSFWFGDSITRGFVNGTTITPNGFPKLFSDRVGMLFENHGIGGTCLSSNYQGMGWILDKIKERGFVKNSINGSVGATINASTDAKFLYIPCEANTNYVVSRSVFGKRFNVGVANNITVGTSVTNLISNSDNTTASVTINSGSNTYLLIYYYLKTLDTYTESELRNSITVTKNGENVAVQNPINYVFIAGGVNDWQLGVPLVDFKTGVETMCAYIKANTNTEVIFITPINHGGWVTNNAVAELSEYRKIITEVVTKNEFSVVQGNLFNFPNENDSADYISAMYGDKLHPTELAYKTSYTKGLLTVLC